MNIEQIKLKFKSGNDIPVSRASLTADEFNFLLSRIAELEAQTQWRDIESAPKKELLLVCEENGDQYVASHHSSNWWCYGQSDDGEPMFCLPTHWMPLPPTPSDEGC